MPKIDRIEGAPVEMKRAAANIIRHFFIAKECQDVRDEEIRKMLGEYGILVSAFELCSARGLLTEETQLNICIQLERIEEGVKKWRNATRSKTKRQDRQTVGSDVAVPQQRTEQEVAGSYE